jgi:folate-dependent phosphoribosylglycinamide formyltransferase PurN
MEFRHQKKTVYVDVLASASLLKLPDQVTNVCPSCLPDVTGYARMVETLDEYESSGWDEMTL